MPRPKKDYVVLNMRVDTGVMKRFAEYCDEVGQTKTLAFERIVSAYLDQYEDDRKRLEEFKNNHRGTVVLSEKKKED